MDNLTSRVIPLDRVGSAPVGGKAAQLAQLAQLGLRVPEGFVIVGAGPGNLPAELDEYSSRLGGAVAVRSSALGEDGAETSFAGQFETVLRVEGAPAIRQAVERCLTSMASARAQAYRDEMHAHTNGSMAVVVQRMVDASAAGVIFTADPVTGQRDRVVINAVRGLGEGLVGGYRTPDHFVLSREGHVVERELHSERSSVAEGRFGELLHGALKAEAALGQPLDLEWAIDRDDQVYWLQARPITTLDLPGPEELDDAVDPTWQLTWHNIAEWMPGAMTPLSWSVVGPSYIFGMNELFIRAGIEREVVESVPLLLVAQGHVFINMSNFYLLGSQMFGMDKNSSDLTLTGHVLPDATLPPNAPALQRLLHTLRYFRLVPAGRKRLDAFIARHASFRVEPTDDLVEYYRRLQRGIEVVNESAAVHVHTSMMAIALLGVFQRIFSKGGPPSAQSQAAVAALLAGARSHAAGAAASSIGVADALNDLGVLIAAEPEVAERFERMSGEEALQWLKGPSSGAVGKAFESFLAVHGHRCIRELELRERDWQEDPLPMVHSLQLVVAAPRETQTGWETEANQALAELSWGARLLIQRLLPTTQTSVVVRERSKSFRVWIARQLKRGYVGFAERLVAEGWLPDADLVFFFTNEELAQLAQGPDRQLVRRAEHRRRLHPRKMAVEFPYVCQGKPLPLAAAQLEVHEGDAMQGTPLSRGVAVGAARVARNLAEAAAMQPGEILVTPFTDVGWTPYFSRAAGLATEVGSVLSHGAVVAREYGLPAVAGFPDLTRRVRTGDMLRVDGNTGELRRVQRRR
ncbi:MAG TPA: PEP/pyruvate-binding domain-containing protein [Burkholderiales bacterium]|nr:PEP/pyruvate-binding domain-containing protein [Burkholderiales bacterium]